MSIIKNPFTLAGKIIIVTGASSGIGRQCAIACSEAGAQVVLMGRDKTRLAASLELMHRPELHLVYALDLNEYDKVKSIIIEIVASVGKIYGVINCAGISTTLSFKMGLPSKMEDFFRVNVIGGMNLTRIVTKKGFMTDEGGSVIFISSVMGSLGESGKSLYSMTKGALLSGSKSLAIELAEKKIRVNCISPGVVSSPMSNKAVYSKNEESLKKIINYHPLGLGKPEDIANACVFLLSDASKWITGINMIVDGGYSAR
ncbi:MAG: SDR family oxidoreductase [Bacteroidetes bacterium]|nr:SDR family oxidoreductase [Bacteroidota bacterium]